MKTRIVWLLVITIGVTCLASAKARHPATQVARHLYVDIARLASPGGITGVSEAGQPSLSLAERQTTSSLWFAATPERHRPHHAARMTWAGLRPPGSPLTLSAH